MKLTKETLKRIIKEELDAVVNEQDLDEGFFGFGKKKNKEEPQQQAPESFEFIPLGPSGQPLDPFDDNPELTSKNLKKAGLNAFKNAFNMKSRFPTADEQEKYLFDAIESKKIDPCDARIMSGILRLYSNKINHYCSGSSKPTMQREKKRIREEFNEILRLSQDERGTVMNRN